MGKEEAQGKQEDHEGGSQDEGQLGNLGAEQPRKAGMKGRSVVRLILGQTPWPRCPWPSAVAHFSPIYEAP